MIGFIENLCLGTFFMAEVQDHCKANRNACYYLKITFLGQNHKIGVKVFLCLVIVWLIYPVPVNQKKILSLQNEIQRNLALCDFWFWGTAKN